MYSWWASSQVCKHPGSAAWAGQWSTWLCRSETGSWRHRRGRYRRLCKHRQHSCRKMTWIWCDWDKLRGTPQWSSVKGGGGGIDSQIVSGLYRSTRCQITTEKCNWMKSITSEPAIFPDNNGFHVKVFRLLWNSLIFWGGNILICCLAQDYLRQCHISSGRIWSQVSVLSPNAGHKQVQNL